MSRTEVARFGVADVSFGCAAGVDLQLQRVGAQVVFGRRTDMLSLQDTPYMSQFYTLRCYAYCAHTCPKYTLSVSCTRMAANRNV